MALPLLVTLLQQNEQAASSPVFVDVFSMAGDTSYATGGMSVSGIQALLQANVKDGRTIASIQPLYCGATYFAEYNPTTGKILVSAKNGGAEVTNATDISGTTFQFAAISR